MTLFIFCGIPFSGKTVLSKEFKMRFGFERVDLDEIKAELLGNVMDESVSQSQWDDIYNEMYKRIEDSLRQGKNVIQDAGNFTEYERGLVAKIGEKLGAKVVTVFVDTPVEIARERWLKNKQTKDRFDVGEEALLRAIAEMQSPTLGANVIVINGTPPIEDQVKQIHDKYLR